MSHPIWDFALDAPADPGVLSMQQHGLIRRMVIVDGLSQREVAKRMGHRHCLPHAPGAADQHRLLQLRRSIPLGIPASTLWKASPGSGLNGT
ncbi:hypothetical protein SH139x_004544 [Planctomycetaceae bacterium SH139]